MDRAKLPCSLDLGYQTLSVLETHDLDPDTAGQYQSHQNQIKISLSMPDDLSRANTLLHECMHAMFKHCELGKILTPAGDDDKEEMIVSVMANGVTELLRRNPDFVVFFLSAIRHSKRVEGDD